MSDGWTPQSIVDLLHKINAALPTTKPAIAGMPWLNNGVVSYSDGIPPEITTQPQSASVYVGETNRFSVVAIEVTSYQWRRNGVNIADATTNEYAPPFVTIGDDGDEFDCVVTGAGGSITTDVATITVTALLPAGAALVLQASSISGLSNDDPIDTWSDDSGNSRDATGSGASRPLYKTDVDGEPAIKFDGSATFLSLPDFDLDNNVTIFVRFKPADHATRQTLFGQNDEASALQIEVCPQAPQPSRGTIVAGSYVSQTRSFGSATRSLAKEALMIRRDGSGANHSIWINGFAQTLDVDGTSNFTGNGAKELGRRSASTQHFGGEIFDVIIYDRTLTDAEADRVYAHLGYGGSDHEFKIFEQSNPLPTSGNGQGVAYDGTDYYVTTTGKIYRLTKSGLTYTQADDATISSASTPGRTQLTDLDYHDSKLWLTGNTYPANPGVGWIIKVDPATLAVDAVYDTEAYQCEGCAWHDVGDGDELWVVYNNSAVVSRYDDTLTLVGSYTLPLYDNYGLGYQGAFWIGDHFCTPIHRDNFPDCIIDVHRWTGTGFTAVGKFRPPTMVSGQGAFAKSDSSVVFAERVSGSEFRLVDSTFNAELPS
jgi:hypothetical protein